jgi:hypothetical protein
MPNIKITPGEDLALFIEMSWCAGAMSSHVTITADVRDARDDQNKHFH